MWCEAATPCWGERSGLRDGLVACAPEAAGISRRAQPRGEGRDGPHRRLPSGRPRVMSRAGATGCVTWSPDASSPASRARALVGTRPPRAGDAARAPWRGASGEGKRVGPRLLTGALDAWGAGCQPGSRGIPRWGTGEPHEEAVGRGPREGSRGCGWRPGWPRVCLVSWGAHDGLQGSGSRHRTR